MNLPADFERCHRFINCQLHPSRQSFLAPRPATSYRAVTISRQGGSGGHTVAEKLAGLLQARAPAAPGCAWTVFDRNLVEKVIEDHQLPKRLARFMAEDRISEIADTMDELFGLHPSSWTLVHKTAETILHLAELGNVIIIGRGAHVITRKLKHVLHVRLVASLEQRVRNIQERNHLNPKEALALLQREDLGRQRYLRKYFGANIDDPLLYHLVVNTDLVPCEEAARLVADVVAPARTEALATPSAELAA